MGIIHIRSRDRIKKEKKQNTHMQRRGVYVVFVVDYIQHSTFLKHTQRTVECL